MVCSLVSIYFDIPQPGIQYKQTAILGEFPHGKFPPANFLLVSPPPVNSPGEFLTLTLTLIHQGGINRGELTGGDSPGGNLIGGNLPGGIFQGEILRTPQTA